VIEWCRMVSKTRLDGCQATIDSKGTSAIIQAELSLPMPFRFQPPSWLASEWTLDPTLSALRSLKTTVFTKIRLWQLPDYSNFALPFTSCIFTVSVSHWLAETDRAAPICPLCPSAAMDLTNIVNIRGRSLCLGMPPT
jgi:hypothetical protein